MADGDVGEGEVESFLSSHHFTVPDLLKFQKFPSSFSTTSLTRLHVPELPNKSFRHSDNCILHRAIVDDHLIASDLSRCIPRIPPVHPHNPGPLFLESWCTRGRTDLTSDLHGRLLRSQLFLLGRNHHRLAHT